MLWTDDAEGMDGVWDARDLGGMGPAISFVSWIRRSGCRVSRSGIRSSSIGRALVLANMPGNMRFGRSSGRTRSHSGTVARKRASASGWFSPAGWASKPDETTYGQKPGIGGERDLVTRRQHLPGERHERMKVAVAPRRS